MKHLFCLVCFDARGETSAGIPETFYRTPQKYWLLNGKAKKFGQA